MKQKIQSGFSLIELIIYVAIFATAMTIVASFTVDIASSETQSQGDRSTQQNARFVIERIQFETRWANSVVVGSGNDELILQTSSGQVRFHLSNGGEGQTALFIDRGASDLQLTDDSVEILDFSLSELDPANAPPSIEMSLSIGTIDTDDGIKTDINTIITSRKN